MPVKCLRKQKGYNSNIKLLNLVYVRHGKRKQSTFAGTHAQQTESIFGERNEEKNPQNQVNILA